MNYLDGKLSSNYQIIQRCNNTSCQHMCTKQRSLEFGNTQSGYIENLSKKRILSSCQIWSLDQYLWNCWELPYLPQEKIYKWRFLVFEDWMLHRYCNSHYSFPMFSIEINYWAYWRDLTPPKKEYSEVIEPPSLISIL